MGKTGGVGDSSDDSGPLEKCGWLRDEDEGNKALRGDHIRLFRESQPSVPAKAVVV